MLSHRYELHDIRDVEAFAEHAIQRSGITEFGYLDREDLLAELVSFCWLIAADWDPDIARFSTYATHRIRRFIIDWKRSEFRTKWVFKDRVYERPRPELVSYEAEVSALYDEGIAGYTDGGSSESGQLARAIERQSVDAADDRSPDLLRALRARGSRAAGQVDTLGQGPAREAA